MKYSDGMLSASPQEDTWPGTYRFNVILSETERDPVKMRFRIDVTEECDPFDEACEVIISKDIRPDIAVNDDVLDFKIKDEEEEEDEEEELEESK